MKFIVDEMPKKQRECPFSDWHPYPPIVEKAGDWYCKHDEEVCTLCDKECKWMKEEKHD